MNDHLGDRMKEKYENRSQTYLPRRSYVILRLDGKAFHTLTRNMQRPFDISFMNKMDNVALVMCRDIQGAVFAYVQSDEISILITDFARLSTDAWFDYNVQKMTSIAASLASVTMDRFIGEGGQEPMFDARVFTIPDPIEVENYFIWRQKDWARNSVTMLARSLYSHKELNGKSCSNMHDMMHEKGVNWVDQSWRVRNGALIVKDDITWKIGEAPIFTSSREQLIELIPKHGYIN